jgi:AmmeMemoRadiSam system protein A
MSIYDQLNLSPVEARAIEHSPLDPLYAPQEQIPVITVSNFPALGQLVDRLFARVPPGVGGEPAGAFVTLHRASTGELRGCIGTIEATQESLVKEVINNAISAATRDPRFPPVRPAELDDLMFDVSVLYPPEPIASPDQLDVKQYGVIVERGYRRGLLLPDIPGIDDVATQVSYARMKAGIGPKEPVELFRFRVEIYL